MSSQSLQQKGDLPEGDPTTCFQPKLTDPLVHGNTPPPSSKDTYSKTEDESGWGFVEKLEEDAQALEFDRDMRIEWTLKQVATLREMRQDFESKFPEYVRDQNKASMQQKGAVVADDPQLEIVDATETKLEEAKQVMALPPNSPVWKEKVADVEAFALLAVQQERTALSDVALWLQGKIKTVEYGRYQQELSDLLGRVNHQNASTYQLYGSLKRHVETERIE